LTPWDWPIRQKIYEPLCTNMRDKFAGIEGRKKNWLAMLPDSEVTARYFELSCIENYYKGSLTKTNMLSTFDPGPLSHLTDPAGNS